MTPGAAAQSVAAPEYPVALQLGPYTAKIGTTPDIRQKALALRAQAFRKGSDDQDRFDDDCLHGVVAVDKGSIRVAFRARVIQDTADLAEAYTGQFYDLSPLQAFPGPFLELGRVCQPTGPTDIMALRLAWAALGVLVDTYNVRMMIGCSSLPGACPDAHSGALAALRADHLGPDTLRPRRLSLTAVTLPETGSGPVNLPHLLRSYLNMGGWVSDHAVTDPQLDTLHVFTGLVIDTIPEPRKARLRALAQVAQVGNANPLDLARAAP